MGQEHVSGRKRQGGLWKVDRNRAASGRDTESRWGVRLCVCQSIRATMKYHGGEDLQQKVLEAAKFKTEVSVSQEGSLPTLQMAAFLLSPRMVTRRGHQPIRLGAVFLILMNFNHFYKGLS